MFALPSQCIYYFRKRFKTFLFQHAYSWLEFVFFRGVLVAFFAYVALNLSFLRYITLHNKCWDTATWRHVWCTIWCLVVSDIQLMDTELYALELSNTANKRSAVFSAQQLRIQFLIVNLRYIKVVIDLLNGLVYRRTSEWTVSSCLVSSRWVVALIHEWHYYKRV